MKEAEMLKAQAEAQAQEAQAEVEAMGLAEAKPKPEKLEPAEEVLLDKEPALVHDIAEPIAAKASEGRTDNKWFFIY